MAESARLRQSLGFAKGSGKDVLPQHALWKPCLFIAAILFLAAMARSFEWIDPLIGAFFLLLGAPHGGTEVVDGRDEAPTLHFCFVYLAAAAIIGAIWLIMPVTALVAFLAISAWHFGREEPHLKTMGIATVLGSLALWPAQTLGYFALITGQPVMFDGTVLLCVQIIGFLALLTLQAEAILKSEDLARASAAVLILIFLPPVLAVGTLFLFFHALPKYRSVWVSRKFSIKATLRVYAPTAIPTLLGGTALMVLFVTGHMPALWVGASGIALATPHILDPSEHIHL